MAWVDVVGALLAVSIGSDGNWFFASTIVLTLVMLNAVMLIPSIRPMRWISPALAIIFILSLYPMFYTLYVAFTNFSDGHRATKIEAIDLLAERRFLPEGGATYQWFVFQDQAGSYALWLIDTDGNSFFARPGTAFEAVTTSTSGSEPTNAEGVPVTYGGYTLLERGARFRALSDIQSLTFGDQDNAVGVRSAEVAGAFAQQWTYDAQTDTLTDNATGTGYLANNTTGEFVAKGWLNCPTRLLGWHRFRQLHPHHPHNAVTRTVVSRGGVDVCFRGDRFAVWVQRWVAYCAVAQRQRHLVARRPCAADYPLRRSGLGECAGLARDVERQHRGDPRSVARGIWVVANLSTDPVWAKVAVLVVNLWFSAPYFMLIGSGALQGIPAVMYEAAQVDGANRWEQFWQITLPLVLVSLGPLIIASIIFNFNNFFIMEGLFQGGPPMAGTSAPPVGHTDNLISYTYRLAFSTGGTKDYGLASAMGVIIFLIVGVMTMVQFRLMRTWEQVSENV
ncbi:MAG UNVERIFIED_CONTAM: ABC transporter permease subunit [Anaerolineae bacterium]